MGKKITLFLLDGNDSGPRTIEIGNWSGKAIHTPRTTLHKLLAREEYNKPGVYILKSDPNEDIYSERIYIGESENLKERLKQHLSNPQKDFKECVVFISKDELLTKSHIKYLESRLVKIAYDSKNAEIDNGNIPTQSTLSEADISDMEYFLDQIRLVLPTIGMSFLISNIQPNKPTVLGSILKNDQIEYKLKGKFKATLIETDQDLIVQKNSEANLNTFNSINKGWTKQREKLKASGILIESDGKYVFTADTVFSSPSAASSVILGRNSPGPSIWIDEKGNSLKDNELKNI